MICWDDYGLYIVWCPECGSTTLLWVLVSGTAAGMEPMHCARCDGTGTVRSLTITGPVGQ